MIYSIEDYNRKLIEDFSSLVQGQTLILKFKDGKTIRGTYNKTIFGKEPINNGSTAIYPNDYKDVPMEVVVDGIRIILDFTNLTSIEIEE